MTTPTLHLSEDFQRLYCDAALFDSFSRFHPISFRRILPFQEQDAVIDDQQLLFAEEAVRADNNADTRGALVDEYFRCGLLEQRDAVNLKAAIDSFDLEFFDLMGQDLRERRHVSMCAPVVWGTDWFVGKPSPGFA
jgi:hypothetical protein